jgi:hypothetical protein
MAVDDPFVPLRDWRTSLYRGGQAVVDLFLDKIDARLPPDWVRDRNCESTRARPDRTRCYLYDQAGDAAVRVWLQRVTATRVRGGPVQLIHPPPSGNAESVGELVARFADAIVLPAARSAGALCTRPAFGPRSALTPAVDMLFTQFADAADGEWPLTDRAQGLWDELVSGCLAEQAAIDRDELHHWFKDSGWEREAASALVDRFFTDSEWLAKRLAIVAP